MGGSFKGNHDNKLTRLKRLFLLDGPRPSHAPKSLRFRVLRFEGYSRMPGLVGFFTKMPRELAEPRLHRMVESLRHESFYATGTWIDEDLGVYVGWVARKKSFSDGMPVCNESGDIVLFFSGEEFPEPGITQRLKNRGHVLDSKGPSYLVHLYEEASCFPKDLNGRFHGLLADRTQGTSTLFNDRYAMHRLYYHESAETFYFAAEAKAILAVRPDLRKADLQGLGEMVSCGCVLENRTIFKGIYVLPPAAAWTFRGGAIEGKNAYFQPREWEEQTLLEPEPYYQQLREVFSRNLPRYFNGPEQIGVSLTGGLDTRAVLAWQKPEPRSLPCYTFNGMLRDSQDTLIARQIAHMCQQNHEVISVTNEFLSQFPRYAERSVYLTDGCTGVDRSVDLYLNERARRIAPVRMTGNYGGEVLRRVRAFKAQEPSSGLFQPEFEAHVKSANTTYNRQVLAHPLSFAVFRQAPWHHYGLLALEQTQLTLRSPYLDNDFIGTVFRAPESASLNNDVCLRLIADGDTALRRVRTDRGLAGRRGPLFSAALRTLLEFTFKAEYAYDSGMPQQVARIDHIFSSLHLERLFLGRHKFAHYRLWFRDSLSKYVQEVLLDPVSLSRPYLEGKMAEKIVQGHLKGNHNYTNEINTLLTLEIQQRLFFDGL